MEESSEVRSVASARSNRSPFVSAVERFSVTRLHGRGLQEVKVWESSVPRLPAGGCSR